MTVTAMPEASQVVGPDDDAPAPGAKGHSPVVVRDVERTACCIVGGGPGGMILALLLARQGIAVTLLEKHGDFDRDFRGDTIHPGGMELLDQIGLADRLLERPHTKLRTMRVNTASTSAALLNLSVLKTRFPYITFMPQVEFLNFLAAEAARYPNFHLVFHADVTELVERDGVVRGVRYRSPDGWHEVRALLTVGADGRFSRVRRLLGAEAVGTSAPIDVLWFRLPRRADDGEGGAGNLYQGTIVVQLERGEDEWQMAYAMPKGGYKALQAEGLAVLRANIAAVLPRLADRVDLLTSWRQFSMLSVESSRVPCWYKPGALLIGDAAHVMSPVAGVGINYAIQDAVIATNVLSASVLRGKIYMRELAEVQRQGEWPVVCIQAVQRLVQNLVLKPALEAIRPFTLPPILRLPPARFLLANMLAYGVRRVHLRR